MKLTILIPVYNEEKTIIGVLQRIKKTKVDDIDYETIVINDGSTDGTKKLLEDNNTLYNSLINNSRNSGKGFSVKQGLKISTGEYIIFQDADLEYDPIEFKKFIKVFSEFNADVILVSDTGIFSNDIPSITTGLRGLSYVEVEVEGPNRDLHSGLYGGCVANPINILSKMISSLHDKNNKITIPGFYDKVLLYPSK